MIKCPKCLTSPAVIDPYYGPLWCDSCNSKKKPMSKGMYEFAPESVKEDRKKYFKSTIQPYRDGELSREFVETYPDKAQGMAKEGLVTQNQVRNAKYTWKDLPGWHQRDKSL